MNTAEDRYTGFALCREMMETPDVMRRFNPAALDTLVGLLKGSDRLLLTGEGSSRLFPAKRARKAALSNSGSAGIPFTEGCTQAGEYDLTGFGILGASNSGRTRELVRLFDELGKSGHGRLAGITAYEDTPLQKNADVTCVLQCGPEDAVAATKSVVEQAMVIQAVMAALNGERFPETGAGAEAVESALSAAVPEGFARAMAEARMVFFAGRNDGVAEELALKTNEIVRKASGYLEGTYAAHGIEEVMSSNDVVILVDPFPAEEAKLKECLADAIGVKILAIADRDTLFPTLRIPDAGVWKEYVQLAAGWNLLVEAGIASGVNLDKPVRARKVGNEVD